MLKHYTMNQISVRLKLDTTLLVLTAAKRHLVTDSPSPTYFWRSSDGRTTKSVAWHLPATARARYVLPVPGGP